VKTRTSRPEEHRRDAGATEDRRIGPERHPDDRGRTPHRRRGIDEQRRQRIGRIDLVGVAAEDHARLRLDLRILGAKAGQDLVRLVERGCGRLAWQRTPLELQRGVGGIAAQLVATFDDGRVE